LLTKNNLVMPSQSANGVKYYTLEEIIKLLDDCKKQGKPNPLGFDTHPMLFTNPTTHKVVEVFAQDVIVEQGHKVGDKVYAGTTQEFTSDNQLIITTKDGKKLDWKTSTPYYKVSLSILENNKFSPEVEISQGYVFKKECIGAIGCHFDWAAVSCTNISKLDGGK
jgi:hypothetical protein